MSFETRDRLLPEYLPAVINGVIGKKIYVGVAVDVPIVIWSERVRNSDFWLERPTVGAKVENFVGVVQTGRRGDSNAYAERGGRHVSGKFLHAEHGPSLQQGAKHI